MKLLLTLTILIAVSDFSVAFFGFSKHFNTHEEPQFETTRFFNHFRATTEKFFEQSLDNFNPQDTRRWQMRYYENDIYFQPNGPIFIYLGGEWTISPGSISQGTLIVEMAEEMNGILFYTEHRYYGRSRPTANTTSDNLRFLSIDQALADTAHFINFVKKSSPDFANSSVILVGASYSGTKI